PRAPQRRGRRGAADRHRDGPTPGMRDPRPLRRRLPRALVRALRGRRRGAGCPPLIGARDRFPPWVARERSRVAPLIGARDRFTPWVARERSRVAPLIGARDRFRPWVA